MNIDEYDGINEDAFLSFPFGFGFLDESTVLDPEQDPPQSLQETEFRVESIQTTALNVDEIQKDGAAQIFHNNIALDSMYAWEAQDQLRASDLDCGSTRQASPSIDQILSHSHQLSPLAGATNPDGSNDINTIFSMNQTSDASISLNAGISGPSSIDTAAIHADSAFSFETHTSPSLHQPLNSIPVQNPNIPFHPLSASRVSTQPEAGFITFPNTFSSTLGSTPAFNPTYLQGDLSTDSMNLVTHHASSFEITQHVTGLTSSDQPIAPITWYPPQNPEAAIQPFGSETVLQHPDPSVLLPDPSSESWTQPPGPTNLLIPQAILSAPIQSQKNTSDQPISGPIVCGGSANPSKRKAIEVDSSSSQVVRLAKVRSVPENYLGQFSIDSATPKKRKRTRAQARNKKEVEEAGGQCFLCRIKKSKCSPKGPCKSCQKTLSRFADCSTILARVCSYRDRLTGTRLSKHKLPREPKAMPKKEFVKLCKQLENTLLLLEPFQVTSLMAGSLRRFGLLDTLGAFLRQHERLNLMVPEAIGLDPHIFHHAIEIEMDLLFRDLDSNAFRNPVMALIVYCVAIEVVKGLEELPEFDQSALLYAPKLLEIRCTALLATICTPNFVCGDMETLSQDGIAVSLHANYIPEAEKILSIRYSDCQIINWYRYMLKTNGILLSICPKGWKITEPPVQLAKGLDIVCPCQFFLFCFPDFFLFLFEDSAENVSKVLHWLIGEELKDFWCLVEFLPCTFLGFDSATRMWRWIIQSVLSGWMRTSNSIGTITTPQQNEGGVSELEQFPVVSLNRAFHLFLVITLDYIEWKGKQSDLVAVASLTKWDLLKLHHHWAKDCVERMTSHMISMDSCDPNLTSQSTK
ncbi:hypothetical protein BS50DRAFT_620133 [Corynespora cassiicola Philippines]|uniref:Uncharacterized protein n=1 Tax=Corynespora cassiicola Philippines TaxID=1448308 RepID=A0A2T2NQ95_CORCC|nr:hypothetical protein BS50DRAFT_620133 [Corynespora cassiicola Philippines]